jgi:hypothetical protein
MNSNLRNRLLIAAVLATTAPLALTSTTAFAQQGYGHHGQKTEKTEKEKQADREKAQAARQKAAADRQEARQQAARQDVREQQARATARQTETAEQKAKQKAAADKAARDRARAERQQAQIANQGARTEARSDRQQAQIANQAARTDARVDRQNAKRLAKAEQDRLIAQQKARVSSYRTWTTAQRTAAKQAAAAVQAQNRAAQYAYIQDYNNRLYAQQQRYATQSFDYYNDPYFYSAPIYSYMRDGMRYSTNQYGANMLQQAANDGYSEGYHAGRADRMDGWRADYRSSYVYQNASYGFNGYYGDRNEYAYYFRQGFQRGYEDGYYSRSQYGVYQNGQLLDHRRGAELDPGLAALRQPLLIASQVLDEPPGRPGGFFYCSASARAGGRRAEGLCRRFTGRGSAPATRLNSCSRDGSSKVIVSRSCSRS